jgi:ACR3 family arsenite transporter
LTAVLSLAARHGRLLLILGLLTGIALPGLAEALKPWIGEMVAALLFLAALRVGPRQALGAARDFGFSVGTVLLLQVLFPAAVILVFVAAGWSGALAAGLVLMAAASPISGSPHLTVMTGHDPAPALRLLVIGTALLPLTVLPVFWLSPALDNSSDVFAPAGRLLAIIAIAAGLAFAIRGWLLPDPNAEALRGIDGASAIAMAVVVVGLMSAVGPAIRSNPSGLALNLAAAFGANFAIQIAVATLLRRSGRPALAVPLAIVAGNRNIALFLTALPAAVTDPLLLFIGCYQIPMYLTPILLGRFYRHPSGEAAGRAASAPRKDAT